MTGKIFLKFLLALLAVPGAYSRGPCRCGAFVKTPSGEQNVFEVPPFHQNDFDQYISCKDWCTQELDDLSDGGNMNYHFPDGKTVTGQFLCEQLGKPLRDEYVHAYSREGNRPWVNTGERSKQPLCCDQDSNFYPCHHDSKK